jgi:hypothetical protein
MRREARAVLVVFALRRPWRCGDRVHPGSGVGVAGGGATGIDARAPRLRTLHGEQARPGLSRRRSSDRSRVPRGRAQPGAGRRVSSVAQASLLVARGQAWACHEHGQREAAAPWRSGRAGGMGHGSVARARARAADASRFLLPLDPRLRPDSLGRLHHERSVTLPPRSVPMPRPYARGRPASRSPGHRDRRRARSRVGQVPAVTRPQTIAARARRPTRSAP